MKNKFFQKINSNMIIALSAVLISLCALIVSIQQVRIMQTQQKVSLFPYLTVGIFFGADGFGFYLKNSGTGLAKINSYQIFDGENYFKDWTEVIDYYLPEGHHIDYGIMSSNGIQDEMITPEERITLCKLQWTEESRLLQQRIGNLKIKICYSSLLDNYWQVNIDNERVALSEPCESDEGREFEN
ncbi:MAG: hypothetical protein AAF573_05975 [Bacteroidota bacterium]